MAEYVIVSVFALWLGIVTYLLISTKQHYNRLVAHTQKQTLEEILEKLLSHDAAIGNEQERIRAEIMRLGQSDQIHLKHVGLVRFDPFGKSGHEHSFVISLLNEQKSGIVITFIYTHDGVRIYAKRVKEGKGEEHELSAEEQEAVKKSS